MHALLHGAMREKAQLVLQQLNEHCIGSATYLNALSRRFGQLMTGGQPSPEAEAVARRMIEADPNDWRGHDHLGHCRERDGDPEGALNHALAALERAPMYGPLHSRVGCVFLHLLNRPDQAEAHLRRGAELWAAPYPWNWYGEALKRLGRNPEAEAAFAEAAKYKPTG